MISTLLPFAISLGYVDFHSNVRRVKWPFTEMGEVSDTYFCPSTLAEGKQIYRL